MKNILKRILISLLGFSLTVYIGLIIFALWPTGIDEQPARSLAASEDQFITVENLELRYRTFGAPSDEKTTLVLLHGFSNSLQSFRLLAPLLADDYYVVTVDLPGFGLSSKPVDYDYRNENQAQTIQKFIDSLELKNVVIGGHSLGGAVALRIAINEPSLKGLIVMNPGIISTGTPDIIQYLPFPLTRIAAKQFGDRDFRESFLKESFVNPDLVTDEVMDNLQLTVQSEGYLTGMTSMMGQYEPASEAALMNQVEMPVVLVWGAQDRGKSNAEFEQLKAGFQNLTVVVAPNAGHYVQEEAAELVAMDLIENKSLWEK